MAAKPGYGLPPQRLKALLAARGSGELGPRPSAAAYPAAKPPAPQPSPAELAVLGKAVLRLQRGLTGDRDLAGASYMDDPELLAAYLLYYWPVSYAQATRALELSGLRPASVLDLGSGPGPMAAAALDRGATRAALVDKSAAALALAARLLAPARLSSSCLDLDALARDGVAIDRADEGAQGGPPQAGAPALGGAQAIGGGQGGAVAIEGGERFDLICFGHSLNEYHAGEERRVELRAALVERAAGRLAEGGSVLIIDPATLASARDALALRDALCARGWRVIAPCTTDAPCPALAAGPSHSCHDEAAWDLPSFVGALAAQAGLDRALIKMSWFALRPPKTRAYPASPASPPPGQALYRVVSEPMLNKAGRVRRLLCGPGGRFPLSAKKGDRIAEAAGFFALERYGLLELEKPELREGGWGIAADTRIHVAQNPEPGLI